MNEQFNWWRLGLLIRKDVIDSYYRYRNAYTVLLIIMMLNAVPRAGFGNVIENFYYGWFIGTLMIFGTIRASLMFTEMHDKTRNEAWLLLPASALEKTIARLLNSSVFFIIFLLLFITVSSLVIEGIDQGLFGRHNRLFNPLEPAVWDVIGLFLVVQPVFFAGAAWFRKHCWFKTVMAVFVLTVGLGLIAGIAFLILFSGYYHAGDWTLPSDIHLGGRGLNENVAMVFDATKIALKILCFGIMPPFCWYVAWLRVKETQVSYGV